MSSQEPRYPLRHLSVACLECTRTLWKFEALIPFRIVRVLPDLSECRGTCGCKLNWWVSHYAKVKTHRQHCRNQWPSPAMPWSDSWQTPRKG